MKKYFRLYLIIIICLISFRLYPELKPVSDTEFISERVRPPLSITFSAGMASISTFSEDSSSNDREKLIKENASLKAKFEKDSKNPDTIIALAVNNAALGNISDANAGYFEAEKILSIQITGSGKKINQMNQLADLYLNIIAINQHDNSLFSKYRDSSIKLNQSIIESAETVTGKISAYKRLGILAFLSGNSDLAVYYLTMASQNGGDDFEVFFISEVLKMIRFVSEFQRSGAETKFIENPVQSAYNFIPINERIKKHPDDSRYRSFQNYMYLWMLFVKCGMKDPSSFFDVKNKAVLLSPEDTVLLSEVEKYFLIQKTNGTVSSHDLNIFLGMINFIKRDIRQSIFYYNAAFSADSLDRQCMSVLVFLYSKTDDYDNAVKTIQKKISILEEQRDYLWLAALNLLSGKISPAYDAAQKALIMQDDPETHFLLGMVYLRMNRIKEASAELDFVIKHIDADWPYIQELQIATVAILISEGKRVEAFNIIKSIRESSPAGSVKDRTGEILRHVFPSECVSSGIIL